MRKSKAAAAETRKRIVAAAAAEFRKNGIVATGLADLMKAAGLTHGGFYKHFESKDQLVAEACADAVQAVIEKMEAQPTINAAVAAYLSTRHRDDPASGCPLAAIGSELSRTDKKTREAATEGFERLVAAPAGEVGGRGRQASRAGGGLDDDRGVDDGAHRDRRGALGGDPRRGGEELDGGGKGEGDRQPRPIRELKDLPIGRRHRPLPKVPAPASSRSISRSNSAAA